MPLAKDVKINKIIDETEGFVGADMESMIREAAMLALRKNIKAKEITLKDFEEALKVVSPSTTKEIAAKVETVSNSIRGVNEKVAKSSKVSGEIADNILEVTNAFVDMATSCAELNVNSEKLSELSIQQTNMVGKFII